MFIGPAGFIGSIGLIGFRNSSAYRGHGFRNPPLHVHAFQTYG